jgi:NAD-dependent dihydropyrimidine dehydrogenase PreA subunit
MQSFRYIDDVVTLKLDREACVGCGACTLVCPHRVLAASNGKVRIVDLNGCMECGACVKNCPTGALRVTPGVGCAAYIIQVWIKGKEKAACGGPGCC